MEEKSIFDQPGQSFNLQQTLPNATTVLVLGILSIVICFAGVVLGIIALVLAGKDSKLYTASPDVYSPGSYNNLKAGKTCAVIGLVLNSVILIIYVVTFVFILSTSGR